MATSEELARAAAAAARLAYPSPAAWPTPLPSLTPPMLAPPMLNFTVGRVSTSTGPPMSQETAATELAIALRRWRGFIKGCLHWARATGFARIRAQRRAYSKAFVHWWECIVAPMLLRITADAEWRNRGASSAFGWWYISSRDFVRRRALRFRAARYARALARSPHLLRHWLMLWHRRVRAHLLHLLARSYWSGRAVAAAFNALLEAAAIGHLCAFHTAVSWSRMASSACGAALDAWRRWTTRSSSNKQLHLAAVLLRTHRALRRLECACATRRATRSNYLCLLRMRRFGSVARQAAWAQWAAAAAMRLQARRLNDLGAILARRPRARALTALFSPSRREMLHRGLDALCKNRVDPYGRRGLHLRRRRVVEVWKRHHHQQIISRRRQLIARHQLCRRALVRLHHQCRHLVVSRLRMADAMAVWRGGAFAFRRWAWRVRRTHMWQHTSRVAAARLHRRQQLRRWHDRAAARRGEIAYRRRIIVRASDMQPLGAGAEEYTRACEGWRSGGVSACTPAQIHETLRPTAALSTTITPASDCLDRRREAAPSFLSYASSYASAYQSYSSSYASAVQARATSYASCVEAAALRSSNGREAHRLPQKAVEAHRRPQRASDGGAHSTSNLTSRADLHRLHRRLRQWRAVGAVDDTLSFAAESHRSVH